MFFNKYLTQKGHSIMLRVYSNVIQLIYSYPCLHRSPPSSYKISVVEKKVFLLRFCTMSVCLFDHLLILSLFYFLQRFFSPTPFKHIILYMGMNLNVSCIQFFTLLRIFIKCFTMSDSEAPIVCHL